MRIAVVSDIHGNLTAFEAVLAESQPNFSRSGSAWRRLGAWGRAMPLVERKERLKKLTLKSGDPALLYADHVDGYGVRDYCFWFLLDFLLLLDIFLHRKLRRRPHELLPSDPTSQFSFRSPRALYKL